MISRRFSPEKHVEKSSKALKFYSVETLNAFSYKLMKTQKKLWEKNWFFTKGTVALFFCRRGVEMISWTYNKWFSFRPFPEEINFSSRTWLFNLYFCIATILGESFITHVPAVWYRRKSQEKNDSQYRRINNSKWIFSLFWILVITLLNVRKTKNFNWKILPQM